LRPATFAEYSEVSADLNSASAFDASSGKAATPTLIVTGAPWGNEVRPIAARIRSA
jgi:hypothetical protein